jgi:hypothetical protein
VVGLFFLLLELIMLGRELFLKNLLDCTFVLLDDVSERGVLANVIVIGFKDAFGFTLRRLLFASSFPSLFDELLQVRNEVILANKVDGVGALMGHVWLNLGLLSVFAWSIVLAIFTSAFWYFTSFDRKAKRNACYIPLSKLTSALHDSQSLPSAMHLVFARLLVKLDWLSARGADSLLD